MNSTRLRSQPKRQRQQIEAARGCPREMCHRRGVAVVWLLACIPVAIVALQFVLEIGWLHRTRSELQVAVDSAALAGARVWGSSSPDAGSDSAVIRTAAKTSAQETLAAHSLSGTAVLSGVASNNAPAQVNNNLACPGTILLGDYVSGAFAAGSVPPVATRRACRCSVTVTVSSPFGFGSRTVSATSTALWDGAAVRAKLVTVSSSSCL